MVEDARFEASGEAPIRLTAESGEDVTVLGALVQDAVAKVANIDYAPKRRRFSLLLYRFRWEDAENAKRERRSFERVSAALTVDDVMGVRSTGFDPKAKDTVLNVLSIGFEETGDGGGVISIICSDDVTIRLTVECVNMRLVDLTRPWRAGGRPEHGD